MNIKPLLYSFSCFVSLAQASELPKQAPEIEVGQLQCACNFKVDPNSSPGTLLSDISNGCRVSEKQAEKLMKMLSVIPGSDSKAYSCEGVDIDYNNR
ncbi:hypothetical protein ACLFME_002596 [Klebsiella quasipneumoniae]|jgi:hypothetical protein|uniref:hypothetical protein n=1 Tax=Klebsiella quasipneumoniae TaxID=1463165 RepID=UPI00109D7908|nr:hypothetical protein [Klebsiella quasipneumoniae]UDC04454.1 hypothetical protein LGM27_06840 [Klebsiella quasipneumoniae subsp. similipneumoniae]HCB1307313.1 hypothetical protein [Klebsiella quasipneumoniae subsp. similipneumoniae]HCC2282249.1 hypothetical protein [Klebsiella quasipneumoniae]HDH1786368.1 hypothetical protein [Klebsiella quasipneumoniae subsp. similipneumoniae]HDH1870969.1 hypothetical protein [Klebsiella quasipneumoniae subsp. similipneumoniae]